MTNKMSKSVKKELSKNHACYVLITCEKPSEDGNMHVEMTYEGDASLASYLLQGAQNIIDEQCEEEAANECSSGKHRSKVVTYK